MRPIGERTVLVTGSSDGHGKLVARELALRGATLLVHGRERRKTEAAAEEIGAPRALVADLASLDEVRGLADQVDELDTLVNNAGVIVRSAGRAPTAMSSPSPSTTSPTSCSPGCSCRSCASRRGS